MLATEKDKGQAKGSMVGRFFRRMTDDIRQKHLMPIKLLFFVQASTLFVLYPFLTIHMKELGIGVEEAAAMNAITPVVSILMPPLAGMVADRIGNFKVQLSLLSAIGGGASLLLLLVPAARHRPLLPPRVLMVLEESGQPPHPWGGEGGGGAGDSLTLSAVSGHACSFLNTSTHPLPLVLSRCGHTCPVDSPPPGLTLPPLQGVEDRTSVVHLQGARAFLPDDLSVALSCSPLCRLARSRGPYPFPRPGATALQLVVLSTHKGLALVEVEATSEAISETTTEMISETTTEATEGQDGASTERIDQMDVGGREESVEPAGVWIAGGGEHRLQPCRAACLVFSPRMNVCSEVVAEFVTDNPQLTFWSYLAVRVVIGAISGTAFAMFEGAVIALLRKHNADYGLQRMYAALGAMVASPLSGLLLDSASTASGGATDFRPAFYLYAGLKVVSGLLVLTIDLEFKSPAEHVIKDVIKALRNLELVAILGASLALGAAWGFLEGFLFWLLQDLGASRTLMGLTVTVGGAAGLPLLALAGPITARIGHHAVIAMSFVVYSIRLLGYSVLSNPWLCLVFEAMEGVTSSLATTAAVTAVASRSTTSTDSSLQGLLGGLYYGVGKGIGSLVGGLLMGAVGTKTTFRMFAGTCAVVGVVYLWLSRYVLDHPGRHKKGRGGEGGSKEPKEGKKQEEGNGHDGKGQEEGDEEKVTVATRSV